MHKTSLLYYSISVSVVNNTQAKMFDRSVIYLIFIIISLSIFERSIEKMYSFEFGSVFRQTVMIKSTPVDYKEYRDVIQWCEKYIEQRCSWSSPWLWDEHRETPNVLEFNKVNLVYTHDDMDPLYYDSNVYDQYGQEHGITRFVVFGSLYRFILSWTKKQLKFIHNITVSEYPRHTYNMYSHTFYIQHMNTSSKRAETFLLPRYASDQLKPTTNLQKFSDFEKYFDAHFSNMNHYTKQVINDKPVMDDKVSQFCDNENGDCDPNSFQYRYSKFQQAQLTVMSYNVWNMNSLQRKPGGYTKRMNRLKQTILDTNPDIIGLQEMRYEELKGEDLGPNQMYTLSGWLTDYQFVFQPAQMQPNSLHEGRTEEGVAIMSKYPIIAQNYLLLFINRSNSADTHQRVLLHVEIIVPVVGKVHVLNTHLSLSHEAREKSVEEICLYISQLEGPVILLGDMNAEPNEPAMKYLSGQDLLPGVTDRCKLRDIWLETEEDNPGFTYNSLEKDLHKRIDYILYTGWHQCCKVKTIQVQDDGKRGNEAASDHCPVLATFSFNVRETVTKS